MDAGEAIEHAYSKVLFDTIMTGSLLALATVAIASFQPWMAPSASGPRAWPLLPLLDVALPLGLLAVCAVVRATMLRSLATRPPGSEGAFIRRLRVAVNLPLNVPVVMAVMAILSHDLEPALAFGLLASAAVVFLSTAPMRWRWERMLGRAGLVPGPRDDGA